ncbi:MAG: hypothetical protein HFJ54_09010 [Clostridia bacterium]|nr:hypothetical protein [Clostridia bacterium]
MEKKLKIVLCALIILLIAIIAFIGVYSKDGTTYKNMLPDYLLSSEFTGKRLTYFKINDKTEEKIYDKDGKEVDSIPEGANEADYKKENVKINADDKLNVENYKKVKEIFTGRLETLGVTDFTIRLDEETGEIVAELLDDMNTDELLQYLQCQGDFSMSDSKDGTVLISKENVKKASVVYGRTETGGIEVYLKIDFTKEGAKKLAEVSRNYLKTEEEHDENEENKQDDENQKQVTMTIEGAKILTTNFGEEINSGVLTISLGTGANSEAVYEYMSRGQVYAMLINNDEMPITYEISTSEYIESSISNDLVYIIIGVMGALICATIIFMIFKYKTDGIIASLSLIAATAILLLLIRYTKTTISFGGIVSMALLLVLDVYLMSRVLNKIKRNGSIDNVFEATFKTYVEELHVIIVFLIIAVVFTFMPGVKIFSIGMTLFYGIISIAFANLLFMRSMLINSHK